MSSKGKASDLLAKMRKVTGSGAPVAVAQAALEVPEQEPSKLQAEVQKELAKAPALSEDTTGEEAKPARPSPPRRGKPVRYSLDLSPEQHKFLKRFSLEAEVNSSLVMRKLLELLEEDERLANRVIQQLSN